MGLCSTPWAREEPDIVRWAGQTDHCLHVAAGGESVVARGCAETGPLLAAGGRGRLRAAGPLCGGQLVGRQFRAAPSVPPPSATSASPCAPGRPPWPWPRARRGALSQAFRLPRAAGSSAFVGVNLRGWIILEGWVWPGRMSTQCPDDEFDHRLPHPFWFDSPQSFCSLRNMSDRIDVQKRRVCYDMVLMLEVSSYLRVLRLNTSLGHRRRRTRSRCSPRGLYAASSRSTTPSRTGLR